MDRGLRRCCRAPFDPGGISGCGSERQRLAEACVDVATQAGLGRFYGAKLRSGVLYGIYERTGDSTALEEALKKYRSARAVWAALAARARDIYSRTSPSAKKPICEAIGSIGWRPWMMISPTWRGG